MEVPVNVIFVFEGDEECGSRGVGRISWQSTGQVLDRSGVFSDGPKGSLVDCLSFALEAKGDLSVHITVETDE